MRLVFVITLIIVILVILYVIYCNPWTKGSALTSDNLFDNIEIEDMIQIHEFKAKHHSEIFGIPDWGGYRTYNPSVFSKNGQILYAYRISNYTVSFRNLFPAVSNRGVNNTYKTQIYAFSTNPPFEITHYSGNFVFGLGKKTVAPHIQFAAGFDIIDDIGYITYGEQDCHSKLCKIPMNEIVDSLNPVVEFSTRI